MKTFTTIFAASLSLGAALACEVDSGIEYTFYGYPDNSPPGASVAHDCGGRNYIAGGSGTYADPLTFATAPGEFSVCEIIYSPLLKKYLRYEDDCEQCISDYQSGKKHIDIWTGSSTQNGGQTQIDCEDNLTSGGTNDVVRQPPQGLDVDTTALFANGQCNTNAIFESNQGSCSGASANAVTNSTTPATPGSGSSGSGSSSVPSAAGSSSTGNASGSGNTSNGGDAGDDSGSESDDGSNGDGSGSDYTPTTTATEASATASKKHKNKHHKSHHSKTAEASSTTTASAGY